MVFFSDTLKVKLLSTKYNTLFVIRKNGQNSLICDSNDLFKLSEVRSGVEKKWFGFLNFSLILNESSKQAGLFKRVLLENFVPPIFGLKKFL